MAEPNYQYIWRCVKCTCHFANVQSVNGGAKLEKKCPKCKSVNSLSINNQEINLHCKYADMSEVDEINNNEDNSMQ